MGYHNVNECKNKPRFENIWITIFVMGMLKMLFDIAMRWIISKKFLGGERDSYSYQQEFILIYNSFKISSLCSPNKGTPLSKFNFVSEKIIGVLNPNVLFVFAALWGILIFKFLDLT